MNISEQIFNELNTIIEKLKDPNISALEKEELIKRKEDLIKRFSNHCKSGEVTPIKVTKLINPYIRILTTSIILLVCFIDSLILV